jgi:hypothetical protein
MKRKCFSETINWKKSSNKEISKIFNSVNDFSTEEEMLIYIEKNIKQFCIQALGDIYVSHEKEFLLPIMKINCKERSKRHGRIDLLILCKKNLYAIELKNKDSESVSTSRVLGQLMLYQELFIERNIYPQMVLVSSRYNKILFILIQRFRLGYRYILFNKQFNAELIEANFYEKDN